MAEDERARTDIVALAARSLALRDIVARLLAYEATRADDPNSMLQDFSDAGNKRVARLPQKHMQYAELIQKEFDWVVLMAKKQIRGAK
jgi:hypothetical protein